ncbi:hypothetical protein SAMN04244573_03246 [Azotobacter beijerinckii]|uniref:Uncharacterized protein n=1 Tax=Azotobacter beijerinckii TaxID=170623 RepID=A0A1H9MV87_9GAMM|nr:hypothetical protein [Azotobacter beijerinckii]SER27023.1 hypothetical protein SAMN04244573_03246 [Azotobacter beijerinckii]
MDHDEDKRSGQELQIVQAFSSVEVSERIIRSADIKELVGGMLAAHDEVGRSAEELERARQEKKGGSLIGNWWKERGDKLQDAQIDLQQSIGSLSRKSSQLLIVNAAISKVLSDQQRALQRQQNLLKQQADILEEQNRKILGQQQAIELQQQEIDAANLGLLEARDVSAEQTDRLVGSVKRLEEAESQIEQLNQQLISSVAEDLVTVVSDWSLRLDDLARDFKQRQAKLEHRLADDFRDLIDQVRSELEATSDKASGCAADFERKLQRHLQAGQERSGAQETAIQQLREDLERKLQRHLQVGREGSEAREAAAQQLREDLAERLATLRLEMIASQERSVQPLRKILGSLELRLDAGQQAQTQAQAAQREALERLGAELAGKRQAPENAEARLQRLEQVPGRIAGGNRLALAATGLALASLGWQLLRQLGMV